MPPMTLGDQVKVPARSEMQQILQDVVAGSTASWRAAKSR
jgi:hypothetical protein